VLRLAKRFVGGVLALLLLSLVAGNLFGQYLLSYTRQHFPAPGKLVALEGRRLQMLCTGPGETGSTTRIRERCLVDALGPGAGEGRFVHPGLFL
jgi:hypothetical protein